MLLGATAALLLRTFVSAPREAPPPADTQPPADTAPPPSPRGDGGEPSRLRVAVDSAAGRVKDARQQVPWHPVSDLEAEYGKRALTQLIALGALGLLLIVLAIAEVNWAFPLGALGVALVVVVAALLTPKRPQSEWVTSHAGWVVVGISLLGVLIAFFDALRVWAVLLMLGLTIAAVAITAVLLARSVRFAPLILFAAFVLWAGALGYVQEAGDKTPRLELGSVTLTDDSIEHGYYLGRTAERVYLAQNTKGKKVGGDGARHVLVLNNADVTRVIYGAAVVLPEEGGPAGKKQTAPGPTAGGGGGGGGGTGDGNGGGGKGGGGGDEGAEPGSVEPETQPSVLAQRDPIKREPGELNGVRAELHVLALFRHDRHFHLDVRLVNVSHVRAPRRSLTIANGLDDGDTANEAGTVDGLRLIDSGDRELYPVVYDDEGECGCTRRLSQVRVRPGKSVRLWAAFPAPEGEIERLHLTAPGFGWINAIPVG